MEQDIARRVQLAAPGKLVELYDIDFTPVDPTAGHAYFVPGTDEAFAGGSLVWRGNTYDPQPISFTGVSVSGKGALPRPILKAVNVLGTITGVIRTLGSIRGGRLTMWTTFSQYLDNGVTPNPNSYLPPEIWKLDRVITHNALEVSVECRSLIDFSRKKLPGRQMLRVCNHSYRIFDSQLGVFDNSHATCPYRGGPSFTEDGTPTDPAHDQCGLKLRDCRLRFGNAPLPTRAFVGLGKYQ
jgi:lambda family phage minor tail protein L